MQLAARRSPPVDVAPVATVGAGPVRKSELSTALRTILPDDAAIFTEYWIDREALGTRPPCTFFDLPLAGGLGWAIPAAVGYAHARPQRQAVAVVGDGAYMFANPVASHHAASLHGVPLLTVVCTNSRWAAVDRAVAAVYPVPAAAIEEFRLSSLDPVPAFEQIVESCGGHGEVVEDGSQLISALERAQSFVSEGGQALVNVVVSDGPPA
jgi:acetolactate synthase-1/2/3 large subunit